MAELPIHAPNVPLMDTRRARIDSKDERLDDLWTEMSSIAGPAPDEKEQRASHLTAVDIRKLVENGIVARAAQNAIVTAIAYTVVEAHKHRRRFILWPRLLNDREYEAQITLRTVSEVKDQIRHCRGEVFAKVFDVKCAFFKHEAPANMRRWMIFELNGEKYEMQRLPMGARVSPEIQQRLGEFLVNEAKRRVGESGNRVETVVHIDNFRFVGPQAQVELVSDAFQRICNEYDVTLNQDEDQSTFLGMAWDYAQRTVKLGDRSHAKMGASIVSRMKAAEIVSIFGRLFFAAEVLELPLQHCYYAIKFYRKLMYRIDRGLLKPSDEVDIWQAALQEMHSWQAWACDNTAVKLAQQLEIDENEQVEVFTDASDTGFGIVVFARGKYYERAGKWESVRVWKCAKWLPHINQRELAAVKFAEQFLEQLGYAPSCANLHVDNTTALAALHRGRSRSYWLNYILTMSSNTWRSRSYVSSADNWADEPSRR